MKKYKPCLKKYFPLHTSPLFECTLGQENQNGPFNKGQRTTFSCPNLSVVPEKKIVFTQNALNNVVPVRALHGGHGAVKSALAVCHRLGEGVLRVLGGGKDLWEFIQVLQCYSRHSSSGRSSRWSGRGRAGSRWRKSTLRALEKGKKSLYPLW